MPPKREAKAGSATGGGSAAGPASDSQSTSAATTTGHVARHVASAPPAAVPSHPGLASPPLPPAADINAGVASSGGARSAAEPAPETAPSSCTPALEQVEQTRLPVGDSGSPFSSAPSSTMSPRNSSLPLGESGGESVTSGLPLGRPVARTRTYEPQTQSDPVLLQMLQRLLDQNASLSERLERLEAQAAAAALITPHVQGSGDGSARGGLPDSSFVAVNGASLAHPAASGGSTPAPGLAVLSAHVTDASRGAAGGAGHGTSDPLPFSSANGGVAACALNPQSRTVAQSVGFVTPGPRATSFLSGGQRPPASAMVATPETIQSSPSAHSAHQSISSSLVHASAVVATVPVPQLRDPSAGAVSKWLDQIDSYVRQGVLLSLTPYLAERVKSMLITRGYGIAGEPAFDSISAAEQMQALRHFLGMRDKLAERLAIRVQVRPDTTPAKLRDHIALVIARLREWMTTFGGSEAEALAQLMSSFQHTSKTLFEDLAKNTYAAYRARNLPAGAVQEPVVFNLDAASAAVSFPQYCTLSFPDQEAVWNSMLPRSNAADPGSASGAGSSKSGGVANSSSRSGGGSSGGSKSRGGAQVGAASSSSKSGGGQRSQQRANPLATLSSEQRELLKQLEDQGAISVTDSRRLGAATAPSPPAQRDGDPSNGTESQRGGRGGHRGGRGGRGGGAGHRGGRGGGGDPSL